MEELKKRVHRAEEEDNENSRDAQKKKKETDAIDDTVGDTAQMTHKGE